MTLDNTDCRQPARWKNLGILHDIITTNKVQLYGVGYQFIPVWWAWPASLIRQQIIMTRYGQVQNFKLKWMTQNLIPMVYSIIQTLYTMCWPRMTTQCNQFLAFCVVGLAYSYYCTGRDHRLGQDKTFVTKDITDSIWNKAWDWSPISYKKCRAIDKFST